MPFCSSDKRGLAKRLQHALVRLRRIGVAGKRRLVLMEPFGETYREVRDTIAAERRTLPMVRLEREYEFEGRAPGTVGEERTIELLAREFERAGLQPGNDGSWFQDVPLVEITAQGSPRLTVTGGAQPLNLAYRTDFVGASYRVHDHQTPGDNWHVQVNVHVNDTSDIHERTGSTCSSCSAPPSKPSARNPTTSSASRSARSSPA